MIILVAIYTSYALIHGARAVKDYTLLYLMAYGS